MKSGSSSQRSHSPMPPPIRSTRARRSHGRASSSFASSFGLALLMMASSAFAQVDLSVGDIHVSQAIQDASNSITLVAQRSTVVRVSVGVSGTSFSVPGVNGELHVFVNGTEITPVAGLAPINGPITAPVLPSLGNESHTLNFELPAPTGITPSTDVDFVVELDPLSGEADTTNNDGALNNVVFERRCNPKIYYTRINYLPAGLGLPDTAKVEPGVGDAFVRGIFPFEDADPDLYTQGLFPSLAFSADGDGDGVLDSSPEGSDLLDFLASCRQLIVDSGLGADDATFLYGWIRDNPTSGNGKAQIGGFNGWGNTQDIRSQRTFAHELGHNFGFSHNSRSLDEYGWDVTARLDGNPASNDTTGRLKGLELNDIMRGGQLTDSAWIDTTSYTSLLADETIQCDAGDGSRFVAVVSGIIDRSGLEIIRLNPVFRFPWTSFGTPPRLQEGPFRLRLQDEFGQEYLTSFDAREFEDLAGEEVTGFGFFEVMIPVEPNARLVELTIDDGRTTLASIGESEPPRIQILSPEPGASLGESTTLVVEVADGDTPASVRQLQIAWSPNGGESWVPLEVNVPGERQEIELNTTEIQVSEGNGVIRVFVSDGLNTAFADVDGLTAEAAIYPLPEPDLMTAVLLGAAGVALAGRSRRSRRD